MAKELQSINLVAPAFKGINTEDSPLAQDPSFAEVADNAVIDRRGRIAARKGHTVTTTNKTQLGSSKIKAIKEFKNNAGTTKLFSVGNNKILSGTTTLANETPGGYSINADNWKMVNFNDNIYFFQRGFAPLVYNTVATGTSGGTGSAVKVLSTVNSASGLGDSTKFGNEILAAYGRLWVADFTGDKSTIYWSDLLSGHKWNGGSSGSIDISKVWPDGYDEIVALSAHNNHLIIFGKNSIVVYSGADNPAEMALSDTIAGVGCVDRDTVQATGADVLFLSQTGLKSFGRTIQEKSMPISSLSGTITKDIIGLLSTETELYRSIYYPEENFYLITFTGYDVTYCFDIRGTLENGSYRVTRWVGAGFSAYERTSSGELFVGTINGIGKYAGYLDNSNTYRFQYTSPELTFGDSSKLKFLKKLRPIIVGGSGADIYLKWSYDFKTKSGTSNVTLATQAKAEFNVGQFNIGQFSTGEFITTALGFNTNGSGGSVSINMEADINDDQLSLQEINVLALMGKTI